MILTAAHCVATFEKDKLAERFQPGMHLNGQGKIVKVIIHPKYLPALKAKAANAKDLNAKRERTLYDVAFIEVEEKPSKRTLEYPKIISKDTKLGKRKGMELAGYSSNMTYWNGEDFDYKLTKDNLQIADNTWTECQLDYFVDAIKALDKFNKNLTEHPQIKAEDSHDQ